MTIARQAVAGVGGIRAPGRAPPAPGPSSPIDPLLPLALAGLATGGAGVLLGLGPLTELAWMAATAVVLLPSAWRIGRALLRGKLHVDVIALVAMGAALVLHQYLAGAVLAAMLTGGATLERIASVRARRELSALLKRAPRTAHLRKDGGLVEVALAAVARGDPLMVKTGEVVPVDGILSSERAVLDESALTGESRPVMLRQGDPIRSGGLNASAALELRATATAEQSTYAGIVRLVQDAEASRSPLVRLADRFALGFLIVTFAAAAAAWGLYGHPLRALAVLVVATPCPLILAAPAAIIAGVSHAARHGIIIKGGAPLEALAECRLLLLDKTGTITSGRPKVAAVESWGSLAAEDLLALAASLEQLSAHPFAPAIGTAARDRGLPLTFPQEAHEEPGAGIAGRVAGRQVSLGQARWLLGDRPLPEDAHRILRRARVEGSSAVFVALDGQLAGAILLEDPIRTEAPRALESLRRAGIQRIDMVTGDHPDVAELVGDAVGIDEVFAERTPAEKVAVVRAVKAQGKVIVAGDGVNDAPALALADVGVAMGARGATAASEAAEVVLTRDRLSSLTLAVRIARRARRIALQSAWVGMGLSGLAMAFALLGRILPVVGAVVQEAIDLVVILNALRALGGGGVAPASTPELAGLAESLSGVHRELRPQVDQLSALASRLESLEAPEALAALRRTDLFLSERLLTHERDEQRRAYPRVAHQLAGEDPTPGLVRTHREIARLVRLYHRLLQQLPESGPTAADLQDFRRVLYGLSAILALHFSQEDELYTLLAEPA